MPIDPSLIEDADSANGGMPISGDDQGTDQSIVDQFFGGSGNAQDDATGTDPHLALNPDARRDPFPKDDVQGGEPSPDDIKRWEYHQSRADKYQHELAELKARQMQLDHLEPLANLIESDPDLLKMVEERLTAGGPKQTRLEPPQQPVKPENFNMAEAADPSTPSGKYVREMENYRDMRAAYLEKRLEMQEARLRQEDEARAQQNQVRDYMLKVRNELMAKHQFSDVEAEEYIRIFSDPRSRSTDFLAGYYRYLKEQGSRPAQPAQGNGRKAPLPPTTGGRLSSPQGDMQARFTGSIRSWINESKQRRG